MDISEKTLEKIKEENIVPKARWQFLLKDYFLFGFFCASIIVGALATSAILFMLTETDWDVYEYLDRSLFEHIMISMPYLWILVLFVFIFSAYYNFKYTRKGYHYEVSLVIVCSIAVSLFLGFLLFYTGLGRGVHEMFMRQVPFYNNFIYDKTEVWENPQKGLLGGRITDIKNDDEFMLLDFRGKIWEVERGSEDCCAPILVKKGNKIEMIGRMDDDNIFFVELIRPWGHR
jgi:hypothetical protein